MQEEGCLDLLGSRSEHHHRSDNEGKEEEETKGATKVRTDPISTKEVAPKVAIKVETTIEETIAKVITDAKAMTSEAVEEFEATQTNAPGDCIFPSSFVLKLGPNFVLTFNINENIYFLS